MRYVTRWAAGLLSAAACCALAPAAYAGSAEQYPVDGAAVSTARTIAAAYWGTDACAGDVTLTWGSLPEQVNALSNWWNPTESYGNAPQNRHCSVTLNQGVAYDWPMLCTVIVHEFGHLAGHQHSPDPNDVMYFQYRQAIPQCSEASNPSGAPAPAPAAQQASAAPVPALHLAKKHRRRHTASRAVAGSRHRASSKHHA
ncbi:MAG: hypothetical protein NVSMB51_22380 [Solirubrobacteraceae bacterium]